MSANLSIEGGRVVTQPPIPRGESAPRVPVPAPDVLTRPAASLPQQLSESRQAKVSLQERQRNLQEALSRLNEEMRKNDRSLQFSMDKELNRTVIKVRNPHTGEVIRQIPDEAVLRVAHSIESVKGLLINELT